MTAHVPPLSLELMPSPAPIGKQAWRALSRRIRRQSATRKQHADALAHAVSAFVAGLEAHVVGLYHPIGAEVDTRPLANALLVAGVTLAYPRLRADGVTMDFVACAGPSALMQRPRSRLMEPAGVALMPTQLDVVVTPGLAVNAQLARLGQGGGSYDRYLPDLRDEAVVIAAVAQACCLPWGPVDRYDRPAQFVCTESGLFGPVLDPS